MGKLVLFTTCGDIKHGRKHYQINSFNSWKRLIDRSDFFEKVVVFADENSNTVKQLCEERNFIYDTDVERTSYGMPYVRSVFRNMKKYTSENDLVCYLSSDCILFDDFLKTIKVVKQNFTNFLLTAQKFDWMNSDLILFDKIDYIVKNSKNITQDLYNFYKDHGTWHHPMAVDLYVCKNNLFDFPNFPEFPFARCRMDHYLCGYAMEIVKLPVIDITKTCFLLHQEHNRIKGDLRAQGFPEVAAQNEYSELLFRKNGVHGQNDMATFFTKMNYENIVIDKRKKEQIPMNYFGKINYYEE